MGPLLLFVALLLGSHLGINSPVEQQITTVPRVQVLPHPQPLQSHQRRSKRASIAAAAGLLWSGIKYGGKWSWGALRNLNDGMYELNMFADNIGFIKEVFWLLKKKHNEESNNNNNEDTDDEELERRQLEQIKELIERLKNRQPTDVDTTITSGRINVNAAAPWYEHNWQLILIAMGVANLVMCACLVWCCLQGSNRDDRRRRRRRRRDRD